MDSLAEASFGALPSELKISIFLACDFVTIYRTRQVSKVFRKFIDDCPEIRQDVLFLEPQLSARLQSPARNLLSGCAHVIATARIHGLRQQSTMTY